MLDNVFRGAPLFSPFFGCGSVPFSFFCGRVLGSLAVAVIKHQNPAAVDQRCAIGESLPTEACAHLLAFLWITRTLAAKGAFQLLYLTCHWA